MKIVEAQLGRLVRIRSDDDDLATNPIEDQVGQRKGAEEIGSQHRLEAVDGLGATLNHSARVVDQDVHVAVE
jgi:hypothetical protein